MKVGRRGDMSGQPNPVRTSAAFPGPPKSACRVAVVPHAEGPEARPMQHPDRPFPPVPRPTEVAFTVEQPDGSTARLRIEFDLFVDRLAGLLIADAPQALTRSRDAPRDPRAPRGRSRPSTVGHTQTRWP